MIRAFFSIISFFSLVSCASSPVAEEGLALRKSTPIQIYMGTCVVGRSGPGAVEARALDMGFSSASDEVAKKYLRGNPGKAWHLKNERGEFGLSMLNNSLCSVFVHQGDPVTLKKSMEAWLPPENSGFTYKKETGSQTEFLSTTSYKLFRGGQIIEQWVITTNSQPGAELVAIMSYDSP